MAEKTRSEELFDEFKKKANDDIKSGTETFDRNLLAFSSGALGLSLAFIKDIVPLGKAVWIPCLYISWILFALCIMVTMASFQVSIRALNGSLPFAKAYYFDGDTNAFDKHLKTFWCRAVDWCTWIASILFVTGLVCTIVFVVVNVEGAKRMSNEESQKVVTGDLGKGLKPTSMTPLNEGVKPVAMTPLATGENRGIKPVPMTQTPAQVPSQPSGSAPAQPAQSPQK